MRCVALSFDDGPSEQTPGLLAALDKEQVPATFFLLGQQAQRFPDSARAIAANPRFAIGNHTFDHERLTKLNEKEIRQEINEGAEAIYKVTGVRPNILRPPYGAFSETVRDVGVPLVLWDADTRDWDTKDVQKTIDAAVDQARPGSVVLMHDWVPSTTKAAPVIARILRERGYTLVTVPQMFKSFTPGNDYRRLPAAPPPTPHPNAVTWRYRPTDGVDVDVPVTAPRPGVCYPTSRPGFDARNETKAHVQLYRDTGCKTESVILNPGDEQYGDVQGFMIPK